MSLLKTAPSITVGPPRRKAPIHGQGSDRHSRLRVRVSELESLVPRLMEETDRLAVAQAAHVLDLEPEQREMQPA